MSRKVSQTLTARKHFRWFKLLGICATFFVLAKLGQQYQRYQSLQAEVSYYQQELAAAQSEFQSLQGQKDLLYRDSYLEQIARSSLGMVKAGEVVVSPAEISDVPEFDAKIKESDVSH